MENVRIIVIRGGKTGGKIHLARRRGSSTMCGKWLSHGVDAFRVADANPVTCEVCRKNCGGLLDENYRIKR